jgi:hypothetical protein
MPLPHSPELRVPALFATCPFFSSCLFNIQFGFFFFSFFPEQRSVCPGGYADLSQGVPCATYLLTWWSPKQIRSWHLAAREPFWFLHLTWCGDAMHAGWGCGGVGVLPLLGGFSARCTSNISPRVYFRKDAFCFLPLVAILESHPLCGFSTTEIYSRHLQIWCLVRIHLLIHGQLSFHYVFTCVKSN